MRRTIFVVVALVAFGTLVQVGKHSAHAGATTFVSLTFDDGSASQYSTRPVLASHGMAGTFYINSAMVGTSSYYMTWPQIHDLDTAGNEIGGHTLHHTDLTSVNTTTATHEVCDDRSALIAQGFSPVSSFAYPYAATNATAEQIVQNCGYATGRGVGSINSITVCKTCPYAETLPPDDSYDLRTPEPADRNTTLSNLQTYVTNAETHGGGWVILVFHGICDNSCAGTSSLSPSVFGSFLDWLQPRTALGTTVRTVGETTGTGPTTTSTAATTSTTTTTVATTTTTVADPCAGLHGRRLRRCRGSARLSP